MDFEEIIIFTGVLLVVLGLLFIVFVIGKGFFNFIIDFNKDRKKSKENKLLNVVEVVDTIHGPIKRLSSPQDEKEQNCTEWEGELDSDFYPILNINSSIDFDGPTRNQLKIASLVSEQQQELHQKVVDYWKNSREEDLPEDLSPFALTIGEDNSLVLNYTLGGGFWMGLRIYSGY
jgi:hypothetical protein